MRKNRGRSAATAFLVTITVTCAGATALAQDEPKHPPRGVEPTRPQPTAPPPMGPDLPSSLPLTTADRIAKAHNERAWKAHNAFTCDITVNFAGHTSVRGSMLLDIKGGRARLDLFDGAKLIWDGTRAWVSPADAPVESAHYHLHMWPSLLRLPFELNAPGTKHESAEGTSFEGRVCNTTRVTFDEKVSRRVTPKDWLLVHSDLVTHTLFGATFISTYGRSVEDAEREPMFVLFEEPAIVNGVVIAKSWRFYAWDREKAAPGAPIGDVTLSNLNFTQLREKAFEKPESAREDTMPGSEGAHGETAPQE